MKTIKKNRALLQIRGGVKASLPFPFIFLGHKFEIFSKCLQNRHLAAFKPAEESSRSVLFKPEMLATLLKRPAAVLQNVRADYVIYCGSLLTLFIGLANLISWTGGPAPACDSALFCVLSGLGLVAAMKRYYRLTRIAGILLALAANLYLTADLAGVSVSVSHFIPSLTAKPTVAVPIQLAPVAAVVFFLFGCALALLSRRMSNQVLAVKAAIGVVISAIGLIVLCGYVCTPSGNAAPGLPVLMAVCTLMLGVSLCALCWLYKRSISEELSPSSVVIVAIGLILIFGGTDAATVVKTRIALLSDAGVDAAYSEMRAVQKTVELIRTAESNKRGFLLTRNGLFLANYSQAITALRSELQGDNLLSLPQREDRRLCGLITARMTQLDHTIALELQGRHKDALALIRSGSGPALTEKIESEANFLLRDLELEAVSRKAARQKLLQNLINLVVASYGFAILLIAVTVILARFEAGQHKRRSMRTAGNELSEPRESAEQNIAPAGAASQRRVLLIDDSEELMSLVKHALAKHGGTQYVLSWASCLKDGFRELTRGGVSVVLLDLGLPESSGPISYACVRGCAPEVPVLVMTGDDCQQTEALLVEAGADGYLVKQQISGAVLVQAIEAVLSRERPPQVNLKRILSGC